MPSSGTVEIEGPAAGVDPAALEQRPHRAGDTTPPAPRSRAALRAAQTAEAAEAWRMAGLTALCFAGWLLGLVGDLTGFLPEPAVKIRYVVAYLAGGYHSARRAFRELGRAPSASIC